MSWRKPQHVVVRVRVVVPMPGWVDRELSSCVLQRWWEIREDRTSRSSFDQNVRFVDATAHTDTPFGQLPIFLPLARISRAIRDFLGPRPFAVLLICYSAPPGMWTCLQSETLQGLRRRVRPRYTQILSSSSWPSCPKISSRLCWLRYAPLGVGAIVRHATGLYPPHTTVLGHPGAIRSADDQLFPDGLDFRKAGF